MGQLAQSSPAPYRQRWADRLAKARCRGKELSQPAGRGQAASQTRGSQPVACRGPRVAAVHGNLAAWLHIYRKVCAQRALTNKGSQEPGGKESGTREQVACHGRGFRRMAASTAWQGLTSHKERKRGGQADKESTALEPSSSWRPPFATGMRLSLEKAQSQSLAKPLLTDTAENMTRPRQGPSLRQGPLADAFVAGNESASANSSWFRCLTVSTLDSPPSDPQTRNPLPRLLQYSVHYSAAWKQCFYINVLEVSDCICKATTRAVRGPCSSFSPHTVAARSFVKECGSGCGALLTN